MVTEVTAKGPVLFGLEDTVLHNFRKHNHQTFTCPEQFSLFLSLSGVESIYHLYVQRPTPLSSLSKDMKYINSVSFLKGRNGYLLTRSPHHKVTLVQLQLDLFSEATELLGHPDQTDLLCTSLLHRFLGYDPAAWGVGNSRSPEANTALRKLCSKVLSNEGSMSDPPGKQCNIVNSVITV